MRVYSKKKKRARIILFFAVAVVVSVGCYLLQRGRAASSYGCAAPVHSVITGDGVLTVTLSLDGSETDAALELFRAVCEGLGVKPCVFVSTKWLEKHDGETERLAFAELGLLVPESGNARSDKKAREALAKETNLFLAYTGVFPHYVRVAGEKPSEAICEAAVLVGQVCVGSNGDLTSSPLSGSIVDCGRLDGTTGYALAKFCAEVLGKEMECISLTELLSSRI